MPTRPLQVASAVNKQFSSVLYSLSCAFLFLIWKNVKPPSVVVYRLNPNSALEALKALLKRMELMHKTVL